MSLYILDTDCLTLLLRGHPEMSRRVAAHDPAELALTIVTVEETLTGWYSQIRKAKRDDQLVRAYAALQQAVEFCARVRILPIDDDAMVRYHILRSRKPRVGTNDLRIAAIVVVHDAILVTRNNRDFAKLDVQVEDWTQN